MWQSKNSKILSKKLLSTKRNYQENVSFNGKSERKDLQLFASKLIKKILDPCNAKEHHQSYLRKKSTNQNL